jgi:cytochrome P450
MQPETPAHTLPAFPFTGPADDPFTPVLSPDGQKLAPVCRVSLPLGNPAWLISGHREVQAMLRSSSFSADSTRPGFPLLSAGLSLSPGDRAGMFSRMDHPEHTRFRRILSPEFTVRGIDGYEPMVRQAVVETLDRMAQSGHTGDLLEVFARPVPSLVVCGMLGVPHEDHEFFRTCSHHLNSLASSAERIRRAAQDLREYLAWLVEHKRRAGWTDDMLGRLALRHVETGEMTAQELVGAVMLLLVAGHETTVNMIALSVLVLLRSPIGLHAFAADSADSADAVEELLRYLTPMRTGVRRVAVEDCVIGGQPIRAGEGVIALLSAANRDEAVFADPHRLDVHRQARAHLAFGFGPHQCIGQHLGRLELRVCLEELARRYPHLEIVAEDHELEVRNESVVFGITSLPVKW